MNYHRDRKGLYIILFAAAIFIFVIFFRGAFYSWSGKLAHSVGGWLSVILPGEGFFFKGREGLLLENEELKKELNTKRDASERLEVLLRDIENKNSAIASFSPTERVVSARVLSYPRLSLYHTFTISAGENADIGVGDIVYTSGRTAVGLVREVYGDSSTVEFFSSPNVETEGYLVESKDLVRLYGLSNGGFFVKIPHDALASVGEIVTLSGDRRGILGRVVDIKESPQDPFKTVFVRGLVDPRTIDTVFVVTYDK